MMAPVPDQVLSPETITFNTMPGGKVSVAPLAIVRPMMPTFNRLKEKHGIRVFMDTVGLDRAGRFPPRLRRAIEDCDGFICFLAAHTLDSKWVIEEIRLAHEFGKTMIPIFQEHYVEPSVPEGESPVRGLISHQGIKLFDVSGFYVDHAVADLARLVLGVVKGESDLV